MQWQWNQRHRQELGALDEIEIIGSIQSEAK